MMIDDRDLKSIEANEIIFKAPKTEALKVQP